MSNDKENPTPIDAEVQAKATTDLEEAISKELSIEDEEEKEAKAAEQLFAGGATLSEELSQREGFSNAIPPHTILGMPYKETRGRPPK
jgi:hypothetical protein